MVIKTGVKQTAPDSLKIEYEPEVDILTIYLQDPHTALSTGSEIEPGVILNLDMRGALASVEILDASRRYPAARLAAASIDEFIDLKTASGISSIAPVTLRTQAERGKLWALRFGGQWVTTRERLQQYLDHYARKKKKVTRG